MEKRKSVTALIICIVLFAVVLGLWALLSQDDGAGFEGGITGHVVLSEILPGNLTYPAPDGGLYDFIEVRNLSASPVDISGYVLSDRNDAAGYTFPKGTVLPGNGYILCWCLSGTDREDMASFGISRTERETIYLYNGSNVLLDQKRLDSLGENTSMIRDSNGSWTTTTMVTPGFPNTRDGYDAWLDSMGADRMQVVISEIMTGAKSISMDGSGTVCDWIELYNEGTEAVDLSGAYLSDDPEEPLKWRMGKLSIAPGGYAVIPCTGEDRPGEASFALPRSGCTITLSGPVGNVLSSVRCPALQEDTAWALTEDGFSEVEAPTPGFPNTESGYESWLSAVGAERVTVVISEIMTANRGTITCAAGTLCDWVELYNYGGEAVRLSGVCLSDDPDERGKWRLPDMILGPGEYRVIPCAGSNASAGEADFSLSASGCTVTLTGSAGNIISSVTCPTLEDDRAYALGADGRYAVTGQASPGYANTEAGALAFLTSRVPEGLAISEVMSSNDRYLLQTDGNYHDWVELVNNSDASIDLSGYYLSNDASDLKKMQLPEKTLEPGQRLVIICSGEPDMMGKYVHAPFTLSSGECWVYLSDGDGRLTDWLRVSGVPYQHSAGRPDGEGGSCYFTQPTPGTPNGTGVALVSKMPDLLTLDGVYSGVSEVEVILSGENIRYTLDGSVPTVSDDLYTGPITLLETTVLRAASFEEGKLSSDTLTAGYIINENHTLPVVSLTADPDAMFAENSGIYCGTAEREIWGNLSLFDGENRFSIDCGVEMYGSTDPDLKKKSFKLNFRSRYGSDYLGYPVFGDDGPMVYDALVLRAGQDYDKSIFRDELLTGLCPDFTDSVPAQRYRFVVLYINGEYWGIYALKEAIGRTYYAENNGVSAQSVEEIRTPFAYLSEGYQLTHYALDHDMTQPENYEYLASQIDMAALADWMILQGYAGSGNIEENLRFFRSSENGGKWQPVFCDQDDGFFFHNELDNLFSQPQARSYLNLTATVIQNPAFRELFLSRMGQAMHTTLSDSHVLSRIDELEALLAPEIPRERQRWGGSYESWLADVQMLREYIGDGDHWGMIRQNLRQYIGLTDEEADKYFAQTGS